MSAYTAADPFLPAAACAAVDSLSSRGAPAASTEKPAAASTTASRTDSTDAARQESAEQLSKSVSSTSIGGKKVQKPAWALTADAAMDAEQQEEEDLLAFAGGLEFDRYIAAQEDAELQGVLQVRVCVRFYSSFWICLHDLH